MRGWTQLGALAACVALSACKGRTPQNQTSEPAGSETVPRDAAAGDRASATDAAIASGSPDATPAADKPGCDGWRASKIEHFGMGELSITVECTARAPMVSRLDVEARGGAEDEKRPLPAAAWSSLWKRLEAAGWRALPAPCATVTPPPDSFDVTELELAISDGTTTKQVTCDGANVTDVHREIMMALDEAADAAGLGGE